MSTGLLADKAKVRRSFAAAANSYDNVADLQRQVGLALLEASGARQAAGTVLDLGCGTGFLSDGLLPSPRIIQMLALDIALPMLHKAQAKLAQHDVAYVCADAERLPFAANSLDQVFSNLALQWCRNLAGVFTGLNQAIKPGGQFAFAIFGPDTLQELKAAWAQVDNYRHVNEFYSENQMQQFLQSAGFVEIQVLRQQYISHYPSVMALMQELKQLGAHHVPGRSPQLTSKSRWQGMLAAYGQQRCGQGIPATFEVIIMVARV